MREVVRTVEFARIEALPRRVPDYLDAIAWAEVLTEMFAVPRAGGCLRPWQAFSLAEFAQNRGAYLVLGVGAGKTLISFLAPTVVGAKRPLLLVPAAQRDRTWHDFGLLRRQWKVAVPFQIVSKEELQTDGNQSLLENYNPDVLIVDEADEIQNARASVCLRIDRFLRREQTDCAVLLMTATPTRKSIMGYWHHLCWCLDDCAPVPLGESEAKTWALALDEYKGQHFRPGPLGHDLISARAWYQRRLVETPGIVRVDEDSCHAPITIRTVLAREDPVIDQAFASFLLEDEVPDGLTVSDPLSRWRLDGALGLGFYSRYNPAPPEAWRAARRAVAKLVRNAIGTRGRGGKPLDTELQVLRFFEDLPAVRAWREIKDTFEPRTETVWLTDSALLSAVDWLRNLDEPGIVWCGSVEYAKRLAKLSGLQYYGALGRSSQGGRLHEAPTTRSLISSWNANKRGFNLQAWRRQLVTLPPQSAKWLEQVFGRSHRSGQDREVRIDILLGSGGTIDLVEKALDEARFARGDLGLTQKILRATIQRARPRGTSSNEFRWARRSEQHESSMPGS